MRPVIADIAVSFWRLLPANPIVLRVVQGGSKRIRHLWVRVGYLLILLFVMLIVQLSQGSTGISLVDHAKSSTRVFEFISFLQLAMICFLAPIFTAGAISQEKDAETFNVLLTTPLTNAQIVLGSLLSRLFFVVMLLLSGLPIFCITMLFGGVTAEQILLSFGIAGCTAILTGSLAIMISVLRVGTQGTIFSFYLGIGIFISAGLALGFWDKTYVPASIVPGQSVGMSWLAPFHPFLAQAVALGKILPPEAAAVARYTWPFAPMLAAPHTAYMVITLLASVVLVVLATVFVRRGVKQGEPSIWSKLIVRKRKVGPDGTRRRPARRVWANPIAWREATTCSSAANSRLVRYSYILGGLAAGILLLAAYGTGQFATIDIARHWLSGIVMVEFVLVIFMATNTAATAITREREAGTMELLLTTPLTARYIVWGKLRGLVSFTLPLMAVPSATVLAAAIFDLISGTPTPIVHMGSALTLPFLLLVYAAFTCMLGLHMSLKSTRSVQAVLVSMSVIICMSFGLGLCAIKSLVNTGMIGGFFAPLTFVTSIWLVLNPQEIGQLVRGAPTSMFEIQMCLFVGTVVAFALYGAIVAGTYKSMLNNFDMIVRKQSR